jgi:hypothetical protein
VPLLKLLAPFRKGHCSARYLRQFHSGNLIGRRHLGVPVTGILDHPFLALFEVNEDDPEALGIALGPLEVVQKTPEMIGPNGDPIFDRAVQFLKMVPQVGNASIITDRRRPTVIPPSTGDRI